ncbi:hypothetical protein BJ165DRAFT_573311 [Panaeolus papilionaceus]|nr:hypothetical protein BJ165DRAFT_573311 [Panaeolus papilionaceus]
MCHGTVFVSLCASPFPVHLSWRFKIGVMAPRIYQLESLGSHFTPIPLSFLTQPQSPFHPTPAHASPHAHLSSSSHRQSSSARLQRRQRQYTNPPTEYMLYYKGARAHFCTQRHTSAPEDSWKRCPSWMVLLYLYLNGDLRFQVRGSHLRKHLRRL